MTRVFQMPVEEADASYPYGGTIRPRICHVITGLHQGGAEMLLWQVVADGLRRGEVHEVIALRSGGVMLEKMLAQGLRVTSLEIDKVRNGPGGLLKLTQIFRQMRPGLVQTWLYHADLLGGLAAWAASVPRIVWGIHNERLPDEVPTSTRAIYAACCQLASVLPTQIVSCSHSGAENHIAAGYPSDRMHVIENGVDTEKFTFIEDKRTKVRASWRIDADAFVVGFPARVSAEKGHQNFFQAMGRLKKRIPKMCIVLCGQGAEQGAAPLQQWLDESGLNRVTRRLGLVDDMPAFYAGTDLVCSASSTEALSLAVLEALACERPIVATDVGDVSRLLDGVGQVVPANDPDALYNALLVASQESDEERMQRGRRGRARVESSYSLRHCLDAYAQLYAATPSFPQHE